MNWFACSKKFKEKNWCNNFDYNDRQCKNSVITKQCNSSARWQKQTNKQFGDHQEKNSSRKSDFLWKIPSWFYDISIFHEKKTLYIPTNPSKTLKRKKWPKNGQKWPENSFLFVDVQRGMPNSTNKNFQKMPKICNMYVSRVPIMSTNTYTITLDILTKTVCTFEKINKKRFFNKFSIILADFSWFSRQNFADINCWRIQCSSAFLPWKVKRYIQLPLPKKAHF